MIREIEVHDATCVAHKNATWLGQQGWGPRILSTEVAFKTGDLVAFRFMFLVEGSAYRVRYGGKKPALREPYTKDLSRLEGIVRDALESRGIDRVDVLRVLITNADDAPKEPVPS